MSELETRNSRNSKLQRAIGEMKFCMQEMRNILTKKKSAPKPIESSLTSQVMTSQVMTSQSKRNKNVHVHGETTDAALIGNRNQSASTAMTTRSKRNGNVHVHGKAESHPAKRTKRKIT